MYKGKCPSSSEDPAKRPQRKHNQLHLERYFLTNLFIWLTLDALGFAYNHIKDIASIRGYISSLPKVEHEPPGSSLMKGIDVIWHPPMSVHDLIHSQMCIYFVHCILHIMVPILLYFVHSTGQAPYLGTI